MAGERCFTRELFRFLEDLAANNNRPWFQENKERYETHLKDAALAFIEAVGPRLEKISPHFVADPRANGRSLFRIYRDTRFSNDKRPYKTYVGIRFQHENAGDVHAPGYYLHIATDGVWAGCGIWRPGSNDLRRIREAIVEDPAAWKRARDAKTFQRSWELFGDTLKRGPKGFDLDHPMIEDLKRKDFVGHAPITKKLLTSPDLLDELQRLYRDAAPLQTFLCGALALEY